MTKKEESMVNKSDGGFKITQVSQDEMTALLNECGINGVSIFDLEKVKFPSREEIEWSVPDINEKSGYRRVEEIEGVIVNFKDTRSYWTSDYDTNPDQPPDCHSDDCRVGQIEVDAKWPDNNTEFSGPPTGNCNTCQYAKYESDPKGVGQACKKMRNLFVVLPDKMLPVILSVGPGSFRDTEKFFYKLMSAATVPSSVIVGLSLFTSSSKTGVKYPKLKLRIIERLSTEMVEKISAYREAITQNITDNN